MMDPESFCLSLTYLICQTANMTQKEGCLCSIFPNLHHFLSLCLKHLSDIFSSPLKKALRHFWEKRKDAKHAAIKLHSPNLLILDLCFCGSENEGYWLLDYVN